MKVGDLIKVKEACAYGNAYMQNLAGWTGLLVEINKENDRMTILAQGKLWTVGRNDLVVK